MVSRTRQGFGELKWHAPHYEKSWKILKKVYSNFAFKNHVYIALCMQTCYPKPLFWVPVSPLLTSIVLDYFYTNTSSLLCSTKWKKVHPITPNLRVHMCVGWIFRISSSLHQRTLICILYEFFYPQRNSPNCFFFWFYRECHSLGFQGLG